MEPKKDKWIIDILGSLDGIQRAEPNPFLFAKIQKRLDQEPPKTYVSVRVVWGMVASFVLLILLNWQVINQSARVKPAEATDLNTVVSDMQLYPSNNQLYDLWSGQNY
ncbi:hypothetical protein GO755_06970 [Spirosoma sp. HMF4905]|uniref:Uncharacterized protein n=1 Tax=Spirosoma arboris TaxID=2682092 RepID=A0A7K1S820_9BACT|nr:hypothetical protein [Spirosoma arboris]MVM29768.1 hypothetical protein [Spirosoma arboris]